MDLPIPTLDEIRAVFHEEMQRRERGPQLLLRVKDVAAMTGLAPQTIRELIARGEIPTRDVEPYNCILVARSDLDHWVESLPTRRGSDEQKTA